MPARGINHVDLAVRDVERSLAFYFEMLGPVGLKEYSRYPTYRGTEEVVYLHFAGHGLGLRPADGGEYRHYNVGIEHLVRRRPARPCKPGDVRGECSGDHVVDRAGRRWP